MVSAIETRQVEIPQVETRRPTLEELGQSWVSPSRCAPGGALDARLWSVPIKSNEKSAYKRG